MLKNVNHNRISMPRFLRFYQASLIVVLLFLSNTIFSQDTTLIKDRLKIKIGMAAAVQKTKGVMSDELLASLPRKVDVDNKALVGNSFGINIIVPFIADRIKVQTGLFFAKKSYSTSYNYDYRKTPQYNVIMEKQDVKLLAIPIKVRYDIISTRELEVYAGVGGSYNKIRKSYITYMYYDHQREDVGGIQYDVIDFVRPYNLGVHFFGGVEIKITKSVSLFANPEIMMLTKPDLLERKVVTTGVYTGLNFRL